MAVILVVGTVRLIASNANNVFSQTASAILSLLGKNIHEAIYFV